MRKLKLIFILLMLCLCLSGCGTNDEKEENKEPIIKTELTEEEKIRIAEIDAEIEKYTEIKNQDTAKCRQLDHGGAEAYDKCIKEAYNKLNESIKDISDEKLEIESTIGKPIK